MNLLTFFIQSFIQKKEKREKGGELNFILFKKKMKCLRTIFSLETSSFWFSNGMTFRVFISWSKLNEISTVDWIGVYNNWSKCNRSLDTLESIVKLSVTFDFNVGENALIADTIGKVYIYIYIIFF